MMTLVQQQQQTTTTAVRHRFHLCCVYVNKMRVEIDCAHDIFSVCVWWCGAVVCLVFLEENEQKDPL